MTINDDAAAMLALLAADTGPPPLVWFDGAVPSGTNRPDPPYAVIYFSDVMPENAESRSLAGKSERRITRATVHSVGGNAAASRAVAQRIQTAWLDVAPVIGGRTAFPIRHELGQDPRRDESTGALVQDKVDTYRLETLPA